MERKKKQEEMAEHSKEGQRTEHLSDKPTISSAQFTISGLTYKIGMRTTMSLCLLLFFLQYVALVSIDRFVFVIGSYA